VDARQLAIFAKGRDAGACQASEDSGCRSTSKSRYAGYRKKLDLAPLDRCLRLESSRVRTATPSAEALGRVELTFLFAYARICSSMAVVLS